MGLRLKNNPSKLRIIYLTVAVALSVQNTVTAEN
jgi:hypothetical protein